jgi:hypothetical protein
MGDGGKYYWRTVLIWSAQGSGARWVEQAATLVAFSAQLVAAYAANRAGWKQSGAAASLAADSVNEIVTLLKLLALLTARELQVGPLMLDRARAVSQ